MKLKVYGGTPATENLCDSCAEFRRVQGVRDSDAIHLCEALKGNIDFPVARCSFYSHKTEIDQSSGVLHLYFDAEKQRLMIARGMFQEDWTVEQYRAALSGVPVPEPSSEVVQ